MFDEDTTAEEFVLNEYTGIEWNGRKYHYSTDSRMITLHPVDGGEEITLSFEELTEKLQHPNKPVNTYQDR